MFKAMLIAGAGGFIGTCLRYLVGKLAHYVFSSPFPASSVSATVVFPKPQGVLKKSTRPWRINSSNCFLIAGFIITFSGKSSPSIPVVFVFFCIFFISDTLYTNISGL